jgi:ribosomal protein L11 methyltransferase
MRAFRVSVPVELEDEACAALWDAGTQGVEVRPSPVSGTVELLAYFADGTEAAAVATALPGRSIEPTDVPDVDWVARFREGFRAFAAGRFLIAPTWDAPPLSPDLLLVDPGRAFGTGTHETTRLCLAALERLAARRPLGRTLDLGCGTGLLAIAAARLGASPVLASDIDPEATASSRLHARLNATPLGIVRADGARGLRQGTFDLVLANLMALLLVDRSPEIRGLLAPGGALVLSGLLVGDVPFVREAFTACGTPLELVQGEWAALVYEGPR